MQPVVDKLEVMAQDFTDTFAYTDPMQQFEARKRNRTQLASDIVDRIRNDMVN